MLSQRPKQTAYLRAALDGLWLVVAFLAAFVLRSRVELPIWRPSPLEFESHVWLLALAVPLFWALSRRTDARFPYHRLSHALRTVAVQFIYFALLLGTAIFLFQAKDFSRAFFFLFLLLSFALVASSRVAARLWVSRSGAGAGSRRNLLVVGLSREALEVRRKIESHSELHIEVVGHLAGPGDGDDRPKSADVLGSIDDLKHIVEERVVDDVVFVIAPHEVPACERHVAWCEEVGVTVHLKVDFFRTLSAKTYPTELDGTMMLTLSSAPRDPLALLQKRVIDLLVSASLLVLLFPLMLVAALLIRLTSSGPVFFTQQRVGLNGRPFHLYKFRSMYSGAESRREQLESLNEMTGPVFKVRNDPRVTPVGRWLRRFSIDELPQLWNVLRGQMSLVGPRPPLADEVRRYERWQRRRLSMKPGITCLWQVHGRNHIQFEDWMRLDLEYIDNWSLMLDLKILARTVPAVVFARGAR